jgi:hypothetical protein
VDREKQQHEEHMKGCSSTFKSFKQFMESINKYVKRAVIDIQYYLNCGIVEGMGQRREDKDTGKKKDSNTHVVSMAKDNNDPAL